MMTERETLGHELQRILDEKTNPWGITVQSVEIRDVQYSAAAGRRHVAPGAGGAGTAGADHPGRGGNEIAAKFAEAALSVSRKPGRAAFARHEHALRSNQGARLDGDCSLVGGGNHGSGWDAGDYCTQQVD